MKKISLLITFIVIAYSFINSQTLAPRIVSISPEFGDCNVDTNLSVIRIEFDQDMSSGYSFPDCSNMVPIVGDPVWKTQRIIEIPVKLKPKSIYQLYLNSSYFRSLTNIDGIPLNPDYLLFRTRNYHDSSVSDTLANRINYEKFCEYFLKHYSYKDIKGINWENELSSIKDEIKLSKSESEFGIKLLKILKKADDMHLSLIINNQYFRCGLLRMIPKSYNFDDVFPRLSNLMVSENNVVLTGNVDNTGYILMTSLGSEFAQDILFAIEKIKQMNNLPFIIIDLRVNGGGNEQLATSFVSMILTDTITYEKVAVYNEYTEQFDNIIEKTIVPANTSIRYNGRIFVLIGGNIMSSAESFVLMLKQMPNVQLIGRNTYGSSGNPQSFAVTDSIYVNIPSWLAYDMNEELIEGNGIEPDVKLDYADYLFAAQDPIFNYVLDTISHLPFVSVSSKSLRFGLSISDSKSFEISSNTSWTITCDHPWLSIISANDSGNATITVTADENFSSLQREATVVVTGNGVPDKTITVTQNGASPVLNVTKSSLNLNDTASSSDTFQIISNTSWEVKSNQPWLTVNKTSGSDSAIIIATATANLTGQQRSATITVSGNRLSNIYILTNQLASIASGINEVSLSDYIKAYPNPTTGLLKISGTDAFEGEIRIEVYNSLGSIVQIVKKINVPTIQIDISDYPTGIYLINMNSGNECFQFRILKIASQEL